MARIVFIPEIIEEMLSGMSKRCPICGEEKTEDSLRDWICPDCFQKYWMEAVFAVKECIERTRAGVTEEEWNRLVDGFVKVISSPGKPSGATDDDFFYAVISQVNTPPRIVRMALACARRIIEEEKFKRERWESALSRVEEQFPGNVEINVAFFRTSRPEFKFGGRIIPLSVMRAACHSIAKKREREREERRAREIEEYVMGFFSTPASQPVEEFVEKPPSDFETQSLEESVAGLLSSSPDPLGDQTVKEPRKRQRKNKEVAAGESFDSSGNQPKKRKGTREKKGGDSL